MKVNPIPRDQFLSEVLTDETRAGFREASLQATLELARQRRRRRRLRQGLFLGALIGAGLSAWLVPGSHPSKRDASPQRAASASSSGSAPVAAAPSTVAVAKVRIVNDDELLALFEDRPVALIGPPGQQRLIVWDGTPSQNGL